MVTDIYRASPVKRTRRITVELLNDNIIKVAAFSDITMAAVGDAAPRVLRKAGVPFQRVRGSASWHFPKTAVNKVVAAGRRMHVEITGVETGELW